jgi:hypothetical protein
MLAVERNIGDIGAASLQQPQLAILLCDRLEPSHLRPFPKRAFLLLKMNLRSEQPW